MASLLTIDEASEKFQVHRTTLYRAIREGRLKRHRVDGSPHTWVDRDDVAQLVQPARLSESELGKLADHVIENFFESYPAATTWTRPPVSFEATLVHTLASFLKHYDLEPGPDFPDHVQTAVMYENGPGASEKPWLGIRGTAVAAVDGRPLTFHLSVPLSQQLNRLEGSPMGVASPDPWASGP